jgi:hypothetical protein
MPAAAMIDGSAGPHLDGGSPDCREPGARVSPCHAPAWVRVHGAWRKGWLLQLIIDGERLWRCTVRRSGSRDDRR